jgi:CSLREA domain-containing protein
MRIIASLLALTLVSGSHAFGQATFIVSSTGDAGDANLSDGVCDDGGGNCTLRAAIEQANARAGLDNIHFGITGAGPHTIQPGTDLPAITDPVIIDGYTRSGASANTNAPNQGTNAVLMVALDATNTVTDALRITAGGSTVRGLVINNVNQAAIALLNNGGNTVLIGAALHASRPRRTVAGLRGLIMLVSLAVGACGEEQATEPDATQPVTTTFTITGTSGTLSHTTTATVTVQ